MDTDKKKKRGLKIAIIILIILGILTAVWFLFLRGFLENRFNISPDNLFPFGNPSNREPAGEGAITPPPTGGGITPDTFTPLTRDRLRSISAEPTSGFIALETNRFYPSQEGLSIYNESRGEEAITDMPVIRSPLVRNVRQSNHSIYDTWMTTRISQILLMDTLIPSPYETFFANQGRYLTTRFYDTETEFVETFIGQIPLETIPIACDIPTNQSFSFGEEHPAIRGIKVALDNLYGYDVTDNDEFDVFLAESIQEFQSNLDLVPSSTLANTDLASTTISMLTLETLRSACQVPQVQQSNMLPASLSGNFLEVNIDFVSQNPESLNLATLRKEGVTGPYQVKQYNMVFNTSETLFESQFGEWLAQWVNNDTILLQTKPSHNVLGYAYVLDPNTGRLDKILGDKLGLLALMSPDGTKIIYSDTNTNNSATQTWLLDITTRQTNLLSFSTLPDKCTWATDSSAAFCGVPNNGLEVGEPDLWFQGRTHYTDSIWKINLDGSTQRLYNMAVGNLQEIDVYKMAYDPFEGNYLYFLDKNTNYLWSLEIDGLVE